jgi:steroid delta-isomerase
MSPLEQWGEFWQDLTPESVGRVRLLCESNVRFIDPFNDFTGVDHLESLLHHLFATLEHPIFRVEDQALGRDAGYLRWTFQASFRRRPIFIEGMSEIHFTQSGLVVMHKDHWDAGLQVYGRVPVLGTAVSWVRKALSHPAS